MAAIPFSISVVIPALDECGVIARALGSSAGVGIERIVVDGGSTDGTRERARALGADLVLASPRGRARQLERGRRFASGDLVLFLHADTRLEPGWADALRRAARDPRVAGGAFRLRFESARLRYRWIEAAVALRCRIVRLPYGDQALFARREVLERSGGVPQVALLEDLDLVRIIRRAGRLALLSPRAFTSARRYERNGVWRTVSRNLLALTAWRLGFPRDRLAGWYRREPTR